MVYGGALSKQFQKFRGLVTIRRPKQKQEVDGATVARAPPPQCLINGINTAQNPSPKELRPSHWLRAPLQGARNEAGLSGIEPEILNPLNPKTNKHPQLKKVGHRKPVDSIDPHRMSHDWTLKGS